MNQKQKDKVVNEFIQILVSNQVSYADVNQILKSLEEELEQMSLQQIIQIP